MSSKSNIAVIGAGLMGYGIAQVFASRGYNIHVYDKSSEVLSSLHKRLRTSLHDLGQDISAVDHVVPCADLPSAVEGADIVFEAGPEDLDLKSRLFEEIEELAPVHSLLASNTSVIPITRIMRGVREKGRTLGTHWWNPPYLVPLVEIIQTEFTDPKSIQQMYGLLHSVGKTPVIVRKDIPGFIGNRLQHALWWEAISLVEKGVCDAETIDTVVKSSFGMRLAVLGPLENADLVGTDLTLAVHEHVLPDLDQTRGPSNYLRKLVKQGRLGMKTGDGFRSWSAEQQTHVRAELIRHLMLLNGK